MRWDECNFLNPSWPINQQKSRLGLMIRTSFCPSLSIPRAIPLIGKSSRHLISNVKLMSTEQKVSFGYKNVTESEKSKLVNGVFSKVTLVAA